MLKRSFSVLLALCLVLCCAPIVFAETPTFNSTEEAAAYVKAMMLAREEAFQFDYTATLDDVGEMTKTCLSQFFTKMTDAVFDAAYAHTGVGNEGDYLSEHIDAVHYGFSVSFSSSSTILNYKINVQVEYHTNAAQEAEMDAAVPRALAALSLEGKSDYEKVRAISDFICGNTEYDNKNLNDDAYDLKYAAYAALVNKTAVCQGYASLFYRMALEAGLDCRIITGLANNGKQTERHAWNIVKVDGQYYYIDTTWIDGAKSDRYFLQGQDGFSDHKADSSFLNDPFFSAYPIAAHAYTPAAPQDPCAAGHTPVTDPAKAPTCTEEGLTEGSHCGVCGEVLTAQTALPPTGHAWDGGTTVKAPTATAEGETLYTCTVCGATRRAPIPKTTGASLPGDVDGDGEVSAMDARLALRASVGLEPVEAGSAAFVAADVNHSNDIGADDARLILRASVDLEDLSGM